MPPSADAAALLREARAWSTLVASAALVGVLAGGAGALVRLTLSHGLDLLYGQPDVTVAMAALPWPLRLLVPLLGGLAAGTVTWLFARRGSQNVADVMEAVAIGRGRPLLSRAIGPALGSLLASFGGGSIGREGPVIQLGAALGDRVAHLRRFVLFSDTQRRALVAAGAAAGFAAAYNTPFAGILFVFEVMLGALALDLLVPIAIATALGTIVTRALTHPGPLYGLRSFSFGSGVELLGYAALGLIAALGGLAFMRILTTGERAFTRLRFRNRPLLRPFRAALGGLLVGVILLALPSVAGNGYEPLHDLLDGQVAIPLLLLLALGKAVATTASVGSGSPGGIFTATLLIGAALGAAAASLLTDAPAVIGGATLIGMAAAVAATTRAPLMAAVLVFELSGDYGIVLPLLIATALATLLARRLSKASVYEAELARRGIPTTATVGERLAHHIQVRDIMEPAPELVAPELPLAAALERLATGHTRILYLAPHAPDAPLRALSLTSAKTYWNGLLHGAPLPAQATVSDAASPIATLAPSDRLSTMAAQLSALDWGELPVVTEESPNHPIGVVTRRALLAAFERELLHNDALLRAPSRPPTAHPASTESES